METARSKKINEYLKDTTNEVPNRRLPVELKGKVEMRKVYNLPLKDLIYNIRNGRFASELLAKEDELKRKIDPTNLEDSKLIQDLLLRQNESETEALEKDLILHGQIEPGIITFDGAVINANRRMAILSKLFEKTRETRFQYLMVACLPKNVDERDHWRIEAGLQFAKEFRLEYSPVNELLKLKEGVDRGLTPADISRTLLGRYSAIQIKEKLEILKRIESFLSFIDKPKEYFIVQQGRNVEMFNSLQSSVISPQERRNTLKKSDMAKLITYAFLMIDKTDLSHWDIRKLGKIAVNQKAFGELMTTFDSKKDPKDLTKEAIEESFKTATEIIEDTEEKDKPARLLKRALSAVQSINNKNKNLKESAVKELISELYKEVKKLFENSKK